MSPDSNGELTDWRQRTRIFLQPIAPPSMLGLFGFAGATFMVAADEAWGYGGRDAAFYIAPFAATFGGIAQFTAGVLGYRARRGGHGHARHVGFVLDRMRDPLRNPVSDRCADRAAAVRGAGLLVHRPVRHYVLTDIFETRLMLERVVCMSGADAGRVSYADDRFTRRTALPPTARTLLQDKGSASLLDGRAHRHRKQLFLRLPGITCCSP